MKIKKCAGCNVTLIYDKKIEKYNLGYRILKCDYCGTEYPQKEYEEQLDEMNTLDLTKSSAVKESHEKFRPKLKRRRTREEIGCALFLPLLIAAGFLPIIITFIAFIFGCDNWGEVWVISAGILWSIFLAVCVFAFGKPRI